MSSKPFKPRQALSLEDAVSETVTDLGGFPAVAALPGIRVGKSALFRYTDADAEGRVNVIPLDVAAVMTAETVKRGNDPHLLLWLQEQVGATKAHVEPHESLVDLIARLGTESGEAFCKLGAALKVDSAQGRELSPRERNDIIKELADVARVAQAGIAVLKAGDAV